MSSLPIPITNGQYPPSPAVHTSTYSSSNLIFHFSSLAFARLMFCQPRRRCPGLSFFTALPHAAKRKASARFSPFRARVIGTERPPRALWQSGGRARTSPPLCANMRQLRWSRGRRMIRSFFLIARARGCWHSPASLAGPAQTKKRQHVFKHVSCNLETSASCLSTVLAQDHFYSDFLSLHLTSQTQTSTMMMHQCSSTQEVSNHLWSGLMSHLLRSKSEWLTSQASIWASLACCIILLCQHLLLTYTTLRQF